MNPVLVVDDDESYRELVVLTLEDHCGVEQALGFSSGQPLLRFLSGHAGASPALVLLDLHMPDVSGLDLLRGVRRLAPGVPVAFLSGAAGEEERTACLAAGASAFRRKPVAYADLIALLQELVRSVARAPATGA
jgi:two-component system KDP operon response regulator KdpE